MNDKHFILEINPSAEFSWEKLGLHCPLTNEKPALEQLLAEAMGNRPGSYLISIHLQVKVLEEIESPQPVETSVVQLAEAA